MKQKEKQARKFIEFKVAEVVRHMEKLYNLSIDYELLINITRIEGDV